MLGGSNEDFLKCVMEKTFYYYRTWELSQFKFGSENLLEREWGKTVRKIFLRSFAKLILSHSLKTKRGEVLQLQFYVSVLTAKEAKWNLLKAGLQRISSHIQSTDVTEYRLNMCLLKPVRALTQTQVIFYLEIGGNEVKSI